MSYSAADFQSDVLAHFKGHSLIHPPDGVDEISSDEAYDMVIDALDKLLRNDLRYKLLREIAFTDDTFDAYDAEGMDDELDRRLVAKGLL